MFPSATVLFNFLNRRNETTSSKQLRPKTHTVTETQEHTLAPSAFIPVCFHHISCLPSLYMKAHSQSLCDRKLAHTVSFPVTVSLYFSPLSRCHYLSLSIMALEEMSVSEPLLQRTSSSSCQKKDLSAADSSFSHHLLSFQTRRDPQTSQRWKERRGSNKCPCWLQLFLSHTPLFSGYRKWLITHKLHTLSSLEPLMRFSVWRCVLDEGNPLRNGIWPTVRALVAVVSVLLHLSSSCLKPSPHRYGIMFKNGIYFLVSRPHERYLFWVPGNKAVWERAQMWRNFKTPFRWFCVDGEKKVCFVNTDITPRVLGMFCPHQGWATFHFSTALYEALKVIPEAINRTVYDAPSLCWAFSNCFCVFMWTRFFSMGLEGQNDILRNICIHLNIITAFLSIYFSVTVCRLVGDINREEAVMCSVCNRPNRRTRNLTGKWMIFCFSGGGSLRRFSTDFHITTAL